MTKINTWKCDICFKIYGPNQEWNGTNESLELYIPAPKSGLSNLTCKFEDTCGDCRDKIIDFISSIGSESEWKEKFMYTKKEKLFMIVFIILVILLGIYINQYIDYNNVCHSWLKYSKAFLAACLIRGY